MPGRMFRLFNECWRSEGAPFSTQLLNNSDELGKLTQYQKTLLFPHTT